MWCKSIINPLSPTSESFDQNGSLVQVSCLVSQYPQSSCPLTNQTCLCEDTRYNDLVQTCVIAGCAVRDQLCEASCSEFDPSLHQQYSQTNPGSRTVTLREASMGCGVPVTDRGGSLKLLHALLFVAHSIFFFLRMTTRALRLVPWGKDDTTIVIAWVCYFIARYPQKACWALAYIEFGTGSFD